MSAIAVDDTTNRAASLRVDADGNLKVAGTFEAEPPEGAATDAKLDEVIDAIENISIDPPVGGATEAEQETQTALLVDIEAGVDGLEALVGTTNTTLTTIDGRVDGIETLLTTIDGRVDGVEASLSSIDTKLTQLGKSGGREYETVAASQTDQVMGASGAQGDYLEGLVCVVATAATSQVQIKDGNGSAITVLPNSVGAGVGTYYVPLGLTAVNSTSAGWKITTAAGVSVIALGDFT